MGEGVGERGGEKRPREMSVYGVVMGALASELWRHIGVAPRPHRTDDRPSERTAAEDFAGREINENAARMQIIAQSDNWIGPAVV